jgi:flagellar hook-associated protein 1 FlgK
VLQNTATGFVLNRADGGASVPLTGTGTGVDPLRAEGIEIVVSGTANTGDRFLIQPTRHAIDGLRVQVTDPAKIAAAAPIRTGVDIDNTGTGKISGGVVTDATNAQLRNSVSIQFLTANTYSINGAGSFTYTDGGDIDVNGVRVQIAGAPVVGDTFTISNNPTGAGDNRNALLLAQSLQRPVLDGGTTSLTGALGSFVADIGVTARQSQLSRDTLDFVHREDLAARDSVSGVNLDEEAANLVRYQQAYQAAAQIIRVSDSLFQTLLGAFAR